MMAEMMTAMKSLASTLATPRLFDEELFGIAELVNLERAARLGLWIELSDK